MSNCSICKVQLDQPGMIETMDCGGDCLGCMAEAGDPDAGRALRKEIEGLRKALSRFIADNAQLNEDMATIHRLLDPGSDNGKGAARQIAWRWVRLIDTTETNQPKGT